MQRAEHLRLSAMDPAGKYSLWGVVFKSLETPNEFRASLVISNRP